MLGFPQRRWPRPSLAVKQGCSHREVTRICPISEGKTRRRAKKGPFLWCARPTAFKRPSRPGGQDRSGATGAISPRTSSPRAADHRPSTSVRLCCCCFAFRFSLCVLQPRVGPLHAESGLPLASFDARPGQVGSVGGCNST